MLVSALGKQNTTNKMLYKQYIINILGGVPINYWDLKISTFGPKHHKNVVVDTTFS